MAAKIRVVGLWVYSFTGLFVYSIIGKAKPTPGHPDKWTTKPVNE